MYSTETTERLSNMGDKINPKKRDPNRSKVTQGPVKPIKKGDTEADILAKLYNFMFVDCKEYNKEQKQQEKFKQTQEKLQLEQETEVKDVITGKEKTETKKTSGIGLLGLVGLGVAGLLFSKEALAKFVGKDFDSLFDLKNSNDKLKEIKTLFESFKLPDMPSFELFGGGGGDLSLSKEAIDPKQVYEYLTKEKGVDPTHAMGMMASIMGESGFRPGALGDVDKSTGKYTSGGLFQHHLSRFEKMKSFVGPDWQNPENWKKQIDFALSEPEAKQYLSTVYAGGTQATAGFVRVFEKSKFQEEDIKKRVGFLPGIQKRILSTGNAQTETEKLYSPAPKENMQRVVGHVGEHRESHDHKGVDYAMPEGTQVSAAHSGVVKTGFQKGGAGQYITITGDDGSETKYMHLKTIDVKEGQRINAGDPIGLSGGKAGASYSGSSEGPHLHFEYRKNGELQDPERLSFATREDITPTTIPQQEKKETNKSSSVVFIDNTNTNISGNKIQQFSFGNQSDKPPLLRAIYGES